MILPVIVDVSSAACSVANARANGSRKTKTIFLIMILSFFLQIACSKLRHLKFIFFLFFLFACTKHCDQSSSASSNTGFSKCLNSKEKMDLQQFFQSLLFKNYGAYVLLGSKPICELSVYDMDSPAADAAFKKFWERLSEEEREKIGKAKHRAAKQHSIDLGKEMDLESSCYRGWLVFQKFMDRFKLDGFLFRAVPMLRPDAFHILFINIQQTAHVLEENYEIFKQAAGMDFDPLEVVLEAKDLNSEFWEKVMAMENHLAKGLLFGFGNTNSLLGQLTFKGGRECAEFPSETQIPLILSTDIVPKGNYSFSIPLFGAVPADGTAEKYGRERDGIESIYRNQDMVEVTLQRLFLPSLQSKGIQDNR